jgi:hypothetical protein
MYVRSVVRHHIFARAAFFSFSVLQQRGQWDGKKDLLHSLAASPIHIIALDLHLLEQRGILDV